MIKATQVIKIVRNTSGLGDVGGVSCFVTGEDQVTYKQNKWARATIPGTRLFAFSSRYAANRFLAGLGDSTEYSVWLAEAKDVQPVAWVNGNADTALKDWWGFYNNSHWVKGLIALVSVPAPTASVWCEEIKLLSKYPTINFSALRNIE